MLIDLSHTIEEGMPVFPGDPEPELRDGGAAEPWHVMRLALGTHSGTHIDAASHYVGSGRTIDAYPLERFLVHAWVVRLHVKAEEEIRWEALEQQLPADGLEGVGVLLHTGWDRHWGEPDAERHPYLSEEAARRLVELGVGLVGTDALNVDATAAGTEHVHSVLLGSDVLIVENLTSLERLQPGRRYECAFVPLRIAGADGSPIRAYARDDGGCD
jgi:arylformamidase